MKCSLIITLTRPWQELDLPKSENNQPRRLVFSPSALSLQEVPQDASPSVLKRCSLLCDCVRNGALFVSIADKLTQLTISLC